MIYLIIFFLLFRKPWHRSGICLDHQLTIFQFHGLKTKIWSTFVFVKGEGENFFKGKDIRGTDLVILDFPVFSNNLTVSPSILEATNISYPLYERGIDSDPTKKTTLLASKGSQNIIEFSYYLYNRQIEIYYTYFYGLLNYEGFIDTNNNYIDTSNFENFGSGAIFENKRVGILLDDTDFRRPRIGYFIKFDRWQWPKDTLKKVVNISMI